MTYQAGDIVRCGPGYTRFTVIETFNFVQADKTVTPLVRLQYPGMAYQICRKSEDLIPVTVKPAPVKAIALLPAQIHPAPYVVHVPYTHIAAGDVIQTGQFNVLRTVARIEGPQSDGLFMWRTVHFTDGGVGQVGSGALIGVSGGPKFDRLRNNPALVNKTDFQPPRYTWRIA